MNCQLSKISHNKKFKADTGSRPVRFNPLLCGRPHWGAKVKKMAFDFKKEFKEFYLPRSKPEIVNVPKANYIAVRGKGNPNEEGGS